MKGLLQRLRPRGSPERWIGEFELPHFPSTTLRILEAIRDPESPLEAVTERLEGDPGLSVRVLQLVNSAGFGLRHAVDDLGHGVQMMGRAALESLVISAALKDATPHKAYPGFEPRRFWRAAARRAATARALAERLRPAERSHIFTAALLQEMAVPLLVERMPEDYGAVLERWHAAQGELHVLEREAFGWDHAEVAATMCGRWGLPERLAADLRQHHAEPGAAEALSPPLALVACLREAEEQRGIEQLLARAEQHYDLERAPLVELLDESFEQAEELARLLS